MNSSKLLEDAWKFTIKDNKVGRKLEEGEKTSEMFAADIQQTRGTAQRKLNQLVKAKKFTSRKVIINGVPMMAYKPVIKKEG